jgi:D-arabinose 5-phosphate isomerase GutQ
VVGRTVVAEIENVTQTLAAINPDMFRTAVSKLSDRRRQVVVLPGEMALAVGEELAGHLASLRDGVNLMAGSEMTASKRLASTSPGDVVVGIDTRRYERRVLTLLRQAASLDCTIVAVTDSPLSPLASLANETFFVAAQGVGPFDSMVGALALVNALVAAVAARLRQTATARLDAIEAAWMATNVLVADPGGITPLASFDKHTELHQQVVDGVSGSGVSGSGVSGSGVSGSGVSGSGVSGSGAPGSGAPGSGAPPGLDPPDGDATVEDNHRDVRRVN